MFRKIFLICGKLPFVWFSKTVILASNSIVANAGLIGKIDLPKTLFPMAMIQEGLYKQAAVFLLMFVLVLAFGYGASPVWMWLIPVIVVQYLMIVACALIGSFLVCFVRDFSMLISLAMIFLMFTSGIFWDVRSLSDPGLTQIILAVNPLAFVLDAYRQILMYDSAPDLVHLVQIGVGFGILTLIAVQLIHRMSRLLALKALTA